MEAAGPGVRRFGLLRLTFPQITSRPMQDVTVRRASSGPAVAPRPVADSANDVTASADERLTAVRDAVASQRMEGLEPDPQVVAELERAAHDGTSFDAVVDAYLARVRAGTA